MADKHSLNYEVRELNLGTSFTNNKTSQYHTIKYDFKPASVDVNKMATVDTGTNNQVTVTVPHLDGAGVPQTVFKGSQRPYTKECVLIIDRVTGEVTLEKLSSNIQVKKTRQESAQKPRPLTPVTTDFTNTTQRSTSRTRVTTNKRVNPNPGPPGMQSTATGRFNGQSGIPAGMTAAQKAAQQAAQPQSMVRSPMRSKTSPPQAAPWSGGGNSTLASLPMIGLDDSLAPLASPPTAPSHNGYSAPPRQPATERGYSERMASERMASERMASERMAAERMASERMASERMAAERMAAERMASERMAAERMATERIASERNAPERIASMQERQPSHAVPPTNHSHAPLANHNADDSSSSSSSDSDSDSGSDSDDNDAGAPQPLPNGNAENNPPLLTDVLNDDLCLSESGSDSD